MSVEYLEITETLYVPECVSIQKELFNLSEMDMFPSAFFNMLIRKEHPLGVIVGCFKTIKDSKKLIGFGVAIADKQEHSAYVPFIGIIKEYQSGIFGYNLLLNLRKVALENGFKVINALFDPLQLRLGKLYMRVGMVVTKYLSNPYQFAGSSRKVSGNVLIRWDLDSEHVSKKICRKGKRRFSQVVSDYNIVDNYNATEKSFLIELPNEKEDSGSVPDSKRINVQSLIEEYVNKKGYSIVDCISELISKEKKSYYLLTKEY